MKTISAHSMSLSLSLVIFISTSLISKSGGSKGAIVRRPSGGKEAFLEINLIAYLKLQNVAGYLGYTINIFI
jgi:hypothetical protein